MRLDRQLYSDRHDRFFLCSFVEYLLSQSPEFPEQRVGLVAAVGFAGGAFVRGGRISVAVGESGKFPLPAVVRRRRGRRRSSPPRSRLAASGPGKFILDVIGYDVAEKDKCFHLIASERPHCNKNEIWVIIKLAAGGKAALLLVLPKKNTVAYHKT
jgi:hypothetical protein